MTRRALGFALTRPKVLTFLAIGTGLLLFGGPRVAALVMFAIAAFKVARTLSYDDLDLRLRLQADKRRHGICRRLTESEREEVFALEQYAVRLREMGAAPELAADVMEETWRILRSAGPKDATARLRVYRQGLPPLRGPEVEATEGPDGVAQRIQRELDLLRATERELRAVG